MNATCAWCDKPLGVNELLAEYPVGRRLAFDPATARIWAICPKCERWNLSYLDEPERRAAVKRLDDFLAATPHHTDADDLTFGEVGDTQLTRVGATGWRSFAAWRYGRKLHKRYRHSLVFTPVWLALLIYINTPAGQRLLDQAWFLTLFLGALILLTMRLKRERSFNIPSEDRTPWVVDPDDAAKMKLEIRGERWTLLIPTHADHIRLEAFDALDALRQGLPLLNVRGASPATVAKAVDLILSQGGPARFLSTTLSREGLGDGVHKIGRIGDLITVALEIAVNEMSEQRALADDLTVARLAHTDANRLAEAIES